MAQRKSAARPLIAVVVILALLVAALLIAEGQVRKRITNEISQSVTTQLAAPTPVDVKITDTSVLWALATNTIDEITLAGDSLAIPVNGDTLLVANAHASLQTITPARNATEAVVGNVAMTARLAYDELTNKLGVPVTYAPDGQVSLGVTHEVLGRMTEFSITGTPSIDPATSQFTLLDPSARIGPVDVPVEIINVVLEAIGPKLVVPTVAGLKYQDITAADDGLHVVVHGENVDLSQLR